MCIDKEIAQFIDSLPQEESEANIYIWGVGNTSALYQEGLIREQKLSIFGYADNDETKWGTLFYDIKVYSPEEVVEDPLALVLICSPQIDVIHSVKMQLSGLGVRYYHIDAYIWGMHKEDLRNVFLYLYDDESKSTLLEIMKCHVDGTYPEGKYISVNPYAPRTEFCELNKNEVFVDCGAYVGDTVERFIWQRFGTFKKILLFEPDQRNISAIKKRITRLKEEWALDDESISIFPYAVSDKSCRAVLANNNGVSNLGARMDIFSDNLDENDSIELVALDDVIDTKVTYLKADVEGYEYRMLIGAQETIKKFKPKLGICIYHNATDFYSIPNLVHMLNPEYHIIIRHYSMQLYDTVLFAW